MREKIVSLFKKLCMEFEWDEIKNSKNIEKHSIDFSDVVSVFQHPIIKKKSTKIDYGEKRWIAIGQLMNFCIVIIYTIREKKIRLISARKANKKERKIYYENIK